MLCWSRFGISFPLYIGDLFCSQGIHGEEAETEVGGEGGVDGAKAKDELVRAEAAQGGAWEVGEGVEDGVALLLRIFGFGFDYYCCSAAQHSSSSSSSSSLFVLV